MPAYARLPINRCNLPAVILGSLTFQQHPVELTLDGVHEMHHVLFDELDAIADQDERAQHFMQYMRSFFLLDFPEEAGLQQNQHKQRDKADYLRMLRGWLFDPDSKEGAAMKSWVESRFGLLPRNHGGTLCDFDSHHYQHYLAARSQALYNSNALETQLDLLYSYCQYEIKRRWPQQTHAHLFRGVNKVDEHEVLARPDKKHATLILNNLNSFSDKRERADEFGDYILEAEVPLAKLMYVPGLLPQVLRGENEYLVIGGVYEVNIDWL